MIMDRFGLPDWADLACVFGVLFLFTVLMLFWWRPRRHTWSASILVALHVVLLATVAFGAYVAFDSSRDPRWLSSVIAGTNEFAAALTGFEATTVRPYSVLLLTGSVAVALLTIIQLVGFSMSQDTHLAQLRGLVAEGRYRPQAVEPPAITEAPQSAKPGPGDSLDVANLAMASILVRQAQPTKQRLADLLQASS
jgi:hypothetical protein